MRQRTDVTVYEGLVNRNGHVWDSPILLSLSRHHCHPWPAESLNAANGACFRYTASALAISQVLHIGLEDVDARYRHDVFGVPKTPQRQAPSRIP